MAYISFRNDIIPLMIYRYLLGNLNIFRRSRIKLEFNKIVKWLN